MKVKIKNKTIYIISENEEESKQILDVFDNERGDIGDGTACIIDSSILFGGLAIVQVEKEAYGKRKIR